MYTHITSHDWLNCSILLNWNLRLFWDCELSKPVGLRSSPVNPQRWIQGGAVKPQLDVAVRKAIWGEYTGYFGDCFCGLPPLVTLDITMENYHFQWENPIFQWVIFNSYVETPEGTWQCSHFTHEFIKGEPAGITLILKNPCRIPRKTLWKPWENASFSWDLMGFIDDTLW